MKMRDRKLIKDSNTDIIVFNSLLLDHIWI